MSRVFIFKIKIWHLLLATATPPTKKGVLSSMISLPHCRFVVTPFFGQCAITLVTKEKLLKVNLVIVRIALE
jgi:hypothetical protein